MQFQDVASLSEQIAQQISEQIMTVNCWKVNAFQNCGLRKR